MLEAFLKYRSYDKIANDEIVREKNELVSVIAGH